MIVKYFICNQILFKQKTKEQPTYFHWKYLNTFGGQAFANDWDIIFQHATITTVEDSVQKSVDSWNDDVLKKLINESSIVLQVLGQVSSKLLQRSTDILTINGEVFNEELSTKPPNQ